MRAIAVRALALTLVLTLGACNAASAVVNVATLPVRAGAKAVDLATTSQSERDEKRGREIRQREERVGRLDREYARQARRCADGDAGACEKRDAAAAEIEALMPGLPYEPR